MSKLASLLALFCLTNVASSKTIEIDWFIPQNEDSYFPDIQASPGDVIVFNFDPNGNSDVYIHPTGECDREGSILIAERGAGTGSYTFMESELDTTIFFTSQAPSHCTLGQFINVNVVEAPETVAPTMIASSAPTSSPSVAPAPSSIFTLAAEKGTYTSLLGAATATGILATLEQLQALGPLTVFAPVDDAFVGVDLSNITETQLVGILSGHVVQGLYTAADFVANSCTELTTLFGTQLSVVASEDKIMINGVVSVVDGDILAEDGVLHGIDSIILDGTFVACPTPMPSSSFIPSDMPSLVPSGMPSTPMTEPSPTVAPPSPTQRPTVAPQPAPTGFVLPSKASRVGGMLTGLAITVVAALMM